MIYKIVWETTIDELDFEVNKAINNGWLLQGGVSVNIYINNSIRFKEYTQAMIKHENKTSELSEENP